MYNMYISSSLLFEFPHHSSAVAIVMCAYSEQTEKLFMANL